MSASQPHLIAQGVWRLGPRRTSVKTRLALICGGLFALSGAILLCINYLLVRASLPPVGQDAQPPNAAIQISGDPAGGSGVASEGLSKYRADTLNTLLVVSGVTLVIGSVVALLLGWFIANRVLRPVREIASTARRLGADSLHERIHLQGPRDELTELADTFDGMLDRLSASFDSQRRFVANASHELRTPLAAQRTLVEVAMARPAVDPGTRELGERLLRMNVRIESLIRKLLVLARSDRGLETKTPVRLDGVVAAAIAARVSDAHAAGVEVRSTLEPHPLPGDRVLLEQLVGNLLDNAIKYNHPGGTVRVAVGGSTALRVVNTGPPVPVEAESVLFEPFRQLGRTRGPDQGVGLGLSIVASIAHAHGGSVRATPRDGGGLDVCVNLP